MVDRIDLDWLRGCWKSGRVHMSQAHHPSLLAEKEEWWEKYRAWGAGWMATQWCADGFQISRKECRLMLEEGKSGHCEGDGQAWQGLDRPLILPLGMGWRRKQRKPWLVGSEDHTAGTGLGYWVWQGLSPRWMAALHSRDLRSAGVKTQLKGILAKHTSVLSGWSSTCGKYVVLLFQRYTHLNAKFQRIARRDKKAFLINQSKEIEKNNRMQSLEISSKN